MKGEGGGGGTLVVQGGRHYVESSGSDLMVFFSVLLDVRCDVPFSEKEGHNRQRKGFVCVNVKMPRPPPKRKIHLQILGPSGKKSDILICCRTVTIQTIDSKNSETMLQILIQPFAC